ncbi:hypothetical protein BV898_13245 [Hypsibius exemplaris]|uniref:Potassium channel inwardly rectifying transmembrane domain-containing protein n=1 Tax=Hypsibius exemplaris TaxID=2072580 RepID=A0A1W0WBC8_HYPEX|nr:hypothetical protein BV898_13245 [Hypsibius exemplaris]
MAMKKISAFRRSSVFTVEGFHNSTGTGWETDVNPRTKRKTEDLPNPKDGFLKKRLRANSLTHRRLFGRNRKEKIRSRLLLKNGQYNILGKNIPHRRLRFFTDFWNTLIDLNYGIVLLLFVVSLISSWLLFAVAFYRHRLGER